MPLPLAALLAAQVGTGYLANQSAQGDAEKARKKQEEEQAMLNAIAAFRGGPAGQAQGGGRLSGKTQGLSILAQLAPLLGQIKFGGGARPSASPMPSGGGARDIFSYPTQ